MTAEPSNRSPRLIDDEHKHCLGCGYNLTGQLAAGVSRCPECGRRYRPGELVESAESDAGLPPPPEPLKWWRSPPLILWAFAPSFVLTAAGIAEWRLVVLQVVALTAGPFALYSWAGIVLRPAGRSFWNREAAELAAAVAALNLVAAALMVGAWKLIR